MNRHFVAAVLFMVWGGGVRVVHGQAMDTSEPVGVLKVDTRGVSDKAGELFERGVEIGLDGLGFHVIREARLAENLVESAYVDGCMFGPCLGAVYEKTKIRVLLVARIHGEGQNYGFVISILDARAGTLTAQLSQTCEVCTVEEAIATATSATVELLTGTGEAEVVDPKAGPTGVAPIDHKEFARLQEHLAQVDSRRRWMRRASLIGIGVGLVAAVAGGVLVVNENEAYGGVGIGGGTALAVSGATMLFLSREF